MTDLSCSTILIWIKSEHIVASAELAWMLSCSLAVWERTALVHSALAPTMLWVAYWWWPSPLVQSHLCNSSSSWHRGHAVRNAAVTVGIYGAVQFRTVQKFYKIVLGNWLDWTWHRKAPSVWAWGSAQCSWGLHWVMLKTFPSFVCSYVIFSANVQAIHQILLTVWS